MSQLSNSIERIGMLLVGTFGTAALAFATQLMLTRSMDLDEYGRLAALLAAVNVLTPVASLGIGWFWLDIFGREGYGAFRWIRNSIRLSCIASALCVPLLFAYVFHTEGTDPVENLMISVFLIPVLVSQSFTDSTSARLQLEERYLKLALWQMLTQFSRTLIVLVFVLYGVPRLTRLLGGYSVVGLITLGISIWSIQSVRRGAIRLVGHEPASTGTSATARADGRWNGLATVTEPTLAEVASHAGPYSFVTFFYLVYSQGVVTIVAAMLGSAEAAFYNVAYLMVALIYLIPNVIYVKFLASKILRWWNQDRVMFDAVFHVGLIGHLGMGVACVAGVMLVGPTMLPLVFGMDFGPSIPVLMVLSLGIPFRFVQHSYGSLLFSKQHIRRKIGYMGVAAGLSVMLNLVLIQPFGLMGAAAASVSSEIILLLLYMRGVSRHVEGVALRQSLDWVILRHSFLHLIRKRSEP